MGFESILDLKEPVKGMTRPALFLDLNVDQIIERITKNSPKKSDYYEYFPLDEECENYRRMIYHDIKKNSLYEPLQAFCVKYGEYKELEAKKEDTKVDVQEPVWHFCAIKVYTEALLELLEALQKAGLESEGLISLRDCLKAYTSREEFIYINRVSRELAEEMDSLIVEASYENGRVVVSVSSGDEEDQKEEEDSDDPNRKDYAEYEEFLRYFDPENEKNFVNPFSKVYYLTGFEQEIVKNVEKKNPGLFKKADKLLEDHEKYEDEVFSRLADELGFYLCYYEFEKKMQDAGFAFCEPSCNVNEKISADDLYDLALACVNLEKDKPVVSNSFYYDDKDLFFVLTGPNQGGKTTFARSMGQLVYFTKIGLDVPAKKANVHWFSDILTHFSVEESVETGRGKLMEELVRLSPMMKRQSSNAFVVINELFTTAANFDAIIMGKNVLSHFIREGCHGIYVTHLRELCDVDERVAGLSAQLDENRVQNFKILRRGVDYVGCAENQIIKFGLGYEKLSERLKERLGKA